MRRRSALIGHLLDADGQDAAVGGNIGTALSEVALREPQPAIAMIAAARQRRALILVPGRTRPCY